MMIPPSIPDVSERKETVTASSRLAAIVESSDDAIIGKDLNGIITSWNQGAEAIFGYTAGEMIGSSSMRLIPAERQGEENEILRKIKCGENVEHFETQRKTKDGRVIDISIKASPIKDVTGKIAGVSKVARDITSHKEAENARRASEARYRILFDYAPDGILIADFESYYLDANASICRMLGYTRDELIGMQAADIVAPAEIQHIGPALTAIKADSGYHREWQFRRKDASLFAADVIATNMPDGNLMALIRDITERKRIEDQLKVSFKEVNDLKAALDEHAIVAITNAQGKITYVNDKFCAISKYSRDELLGQDHRIINSGHHAREFIQNLWATITQGRVWHGEIKNKAKDGSFYWVDTTIVPFLNDQGSPRQYVAIRADITERKQMEEALRDNEERFRTMANSIPQLAWIARADGHVFWYNRRWYEYSGTNPEQMEGWGWQRIHDPAILPKVMENWKRAIGTGKAFEMEFPLRATDGTFRTFLTRVEPLKDLEGRVTQWFGTNTDVEDLKRAEQEILKLNIELEQRVSERTAELEAANKELEAFSYSVSHDLRAPLRGVDGFVGMLKEDYTDRLDAEGNRLLDVVSNEAKRMGRLIDDLLRFSRMGRQPMASTVIDMMGLARAVFESAVAAAPAPPPRFELKPLPPVAGDLAMLRQVFANLIGNAVKFSSCRPAAVIEVGSESRDGESIYYVKDNGVGFDENYSHKLFGVFQRLHSEEEFEGTGVGLALVKRVIDRHGGKIWARATLGAGATFYFTLPTRKERKP